MVGMFEYPKGFDARKVSMRSYFLCNVCDEDKQYGERWHPVLYYIQQSESIEAALDME